MTQSHPPEKIICAYNGGTSTVIVKHDFVPVSALTNGALDKLSTKQGEFERNVRQILGKLAQLEDEGKLVSNYYAPAAGKKA